MTNNNDQLWSAVINKRVSHIRSLFHQGADFNVRNIFQRTPLYSAIKIKSHAVIDTLIRCGASGDLVDKWGISPLNYALNKKVSKSILKLLISIAGATINLDLRKKHHKIYHNRSDYNAVTPMRHISRLFNSELTDVVLSVPEFNVGTFDWHRTWTYSPKASRMLFQERRRTQLYHKAHNEPLLPPPSSEWLAIAIRHNDYDMACNLIGVGSHMNDVVCKGIIKCPEPWKYVHLFEEIEGLGGYTTLSLLRFSLKMRAPKDVFSFIFRNIKVIENDDLDMYGFYYSSDDVRETIKTFIKYGCQREYFCSFIRKIENYAFYHGDAFDPLDTGSVLEFTTYSIIMNNNMCFEILYSVLIRSNDKNRFADTENIHSYLAMMMFDHSRFEMMSAWLDTGVDVNGCVTIMDDWIYKYKPRVVIVTQQPLSLLSLAVVYYNLIFTSDQTRVTVNDFLTACQILIEHGASFHSPDDMGCTPIHYATRLGLIQFLCQGYPDALSPIP